MDAEVSLDGSPEEVEEVSEAVEERSEEERSDDAA